MVCGPLAWYYGSTGYWDQGVIAYGVVENPPGQPGTIGNLYLMVQAYNCSGYLVWSNLPPDLSQPTATDVPWPLTSGSEWGITYYVGSNGLISQVYEYLYIPVNGGEYYQQYLANITIPSQYTNRWYRSNVIWAGSPWRWFSELLPRWFRPVPL